MSASFKLVYSFKFQVTCLVTGMVLVASICVGGVSLLIAEVEMRDVLGQQETSLVSSIAGQIDTDLQDKRQLLEAIADEARAHKLTTAQFQALFEEHSNLREEFFNVTAFDGEGELIANLNNRVLAKLNIRERTYFQETMRGREGVISTPFKSLLSGRPVVVVTQPVTNDVGKTVAVIVAAIDLQRPSFIGHIQTAHGAQGYVFIVDDEGWVLSHPDPSLILQRDAIEPDLAEAIRKPVQGSRDDLTDNGVPVLLTHAHLHHANWTIASSYPIKSAFAPMLAVRSRVFAAVAMFVGLAAIFGWLLIAVLLRPLKRLHDEVVRFGGGNTDAEIFNVSRRDEFGVLSRAIYTLQRHRERAEQALYMQANTDVLTAVHNRRMFEKFLPAALARSARSGSVIAVAFLDIDKFKVINDVHGHAAGDAVLIEFARRISAAVRTSDTVARLAGDEFVIVFEQLKSLEEARTLGQKLMAAISAPFHVANCELGVTSSIGIAVTTSVTDAEAMLAAADDALYAVKAAGRHGYAINSLMPGVGLGLVYGVYKHGPSKEVCAN